MADSAYRMIYPLVERIQASSPMRSSIHWIREWDSLRMLGHLPGQRNADLKFHLSLSASRPAFRLMLESHQTRSQWPKGRARP